MEWVAAQSDVVIAMRIAIGIVYARGRQSLPQAVIIHGMSNLCALRLFSNSGSSYDPLTFAAALWLDLAIYFFFNRVRLGS
jgi:hypothetical protein